MSETAQKMIWTALGVGLVIAIAAILWNPLVDLAESVGLQIRGVQTETTTDAGWAE